MSAAACPNCGATDCAADTVRRVGGDRAVEKTLACERRKSARLEAALAEATGRLDAARADALSEAAEEVREEALRCEEKRIEAPLVADQWTNALGALARVNTRLHALAAHRRRAG